MISRRATCRTNKKAQPLAGLLNFCWFRELADCFYGNCTGAFLAFFDLEFNLVAFVKCLEAVPDYSGMMNEKIRSIIVGKKSKTFFLVKPFYCSFSH